MASQFATIFGDNALPKLWDVHAETGRFEFTPMGGTATAYSAIVGNETIERDIEETGLVLGYSRWVTVKSADLADPKKNATATVDSVEYSVRSIKQGTANWRIELFRATVQEYSRPGYRAARNDYRR